MGIIAIDSKEIVSNFKNGSVVHSSSKLKKECEGEKLDQGRLNMILL